jgi:ElaB/YqjD/DUF883 family membrane-anchored ribosome-binding protein
MRDGVKVIVKKRGREGDNNMDKNADRIAQDIKEIVRTRGAITDKLTAIEQHVGATMHHARKTITQLAEKTTSSVTEVVQTTKDSLDLTVQASRHPWKFVGGALIFGYAAGLIYRRGWRVSTGVVPYYPPGAKGAAVMPTNGFQSSERRDTGVYPFYPDRAEERSKRESSQTNRLTMWAELERALQDELGVARDGFIRFGRGFFREMVRHTIPAMVQMMGSSPRERNSRSDRS